MKSEVFLTFIFADSKIVIVVAVGIEEDRRDAIGAMRRAKASRESVEPIARVRFHRVLSYIKNFQTRSHRRRIL